MYRHVVMFEWDADVDAAHIEAAGAALDAAVAAIPEVAEYRHGSDLGLAEGNYDYAIVAEFASVADYTVYRDHPEHLRVIAEYLKDRISARAAVQYDAG